mmetsp:Transcript_5451/g.20475  ORF Transcript_5451/g.20475 Transcript_5451/m.20475 type:complete len:317 (-) Transcript_5451:21-971(-)
MAHSLAPTPGSLALSLASSATTGPLLKLDDVPKYPPVLFATSGAFDRHAKSTGSAPCDLVFVSAQRSGAASTNAAPANLPRLVLTIPGDTQCTAIPANLGADSRRLASSNVSAVPACFAVAYRLNVSNFATSATALNIRTSDAPLRSSPATTPLASSLDVTYTYLALPGALPLAAAARASAGIISLARYAGPSALTCHVLSLPASATPYSLNMAPALLTRMSTSSSGPLKPSANSRTDARLARSSVRHSTLSLPVDVMMSRAAAAALDRDLHASTTLAPPLARALATSKPIPPGLAPVTTHVLPATLVSSSSARPM